MSTPEFNWVKLTASGPAQQCQRLATEDLRQRAWADDLNPVGKDENANGSANEVVAVDQPLSAVSIYVFGTIQISPAAGCTTRNRSESFGFAMDMRISCSWDGLPKLFSRLAISVDPRPSRNSHLPYESYNYNPS